MPGQGGAGTGYGGHRSYRAQGNPVDDGGLLDSVLRGQGPVDPPTRALQTARGGPPAWRFDPYPAPTWRRGEPADLRARTRSAPPAAARDNAPSPDRDHQHRPPHQEQRVLRVMGVAPGMTSMDVCSQVWHLQGLLAVNPPPRPEDDPLSVFLLFDTEESARAAMREAAMVPLFPRVGEHELEMRLSVQRANRFRFWTDHGTPEEAHAYQARRTTAPRAASLRRARNPSPEPQEDQPPARRHRGGNERDGPPPPSPAPRGARQGTGGQGGQAPAEVAELFALTLDTITLWMDRGYLGRWSPSPVEGPAPPGRFSGPDLATPEEKVDPEDSAALILTGRSDEGPRPGEGVRDTRPGIRSDQARWAAQGELAMRLQQGSPNDSGPMDDQTGRAGPARGDAPGATAQPGALPGPREESPPAR